MKTLEELRVFRLQCMPPRGDIDSYIGLVAENCKIRMYTRTNPFSTSEIGLVERLNMKLDMQFKIYELRLESDMQLQLCKVDTRDDHFVFESTGVTMARRRQRDTDREDNLADRQAASIGVAVTDAMVNVIEKLINKDEVKPELYHVQPSSRMSSRRHSGTSLGQNLGARPKRQQNTHQDVAPLVPPEMQSMHSFNRHFALPPLPYQSCPPVPRTIPYRSYSQEWSSLEDLITRRKKRPSSSRKCTAPLLL